MNFKDRRLIKSNKKVPLKRFENLDHFPNYTYTIHHLQAHKGSILLKHVSFTSTVEKKLSSLYDQVCRNLYGGES